MTPRRRSPCACSRRRPVRPVRRAPRQRGASIVTRRTLADLPRVSGVPPAASASGFATIAPVRVVSSLERLPTVAAPWARRTLRLAQRLVALGVALGGKAGVHLGHQWVLVEPQYPGSVCCVGSPPRRSPRPPSWRGRFRPAQTPDLRHHPGGPGASAAGGVAPRSTKETVAQCGSGRIRGRDCTRSVDRLCRRRTARVSHGHPGRRPLSSDAKSPGSAGPGVQHAQPGSRRGQWADAPAARPPA